jgi:hypothetical protein
MAMEPARKPRFTFWHAIAIAWVLLLANELFGSAFGALRIPYSDFKAALAAGPREAA